MTDNRILENRLWNFRQLVKAANGNNSAAEVLGVRSPYITQIAGPNPKRTIGDRMAARIESAFGLEPGALDMDPPPEANAQDPFIAEIVATLSHVDQADKEFVLGMTQWIARRSTENRSVSAKAGKVSLANEADSLNYDKRDINHASGITNAVTLAKHQKSTARGKSNAK